MTLCTHEVVVLIKSNTIYKTLFFLKNNLFSQCKTLTDILSSEKVNRTQVRLIHNILSTKYSVRFFIHHYLSHKETHSKTTSNLYNVACWLEREVWDMSGVFFLGFT